MEAYETFEHAGLTVSIHQDQSSGNPRKEWDQLGTIYMERHREWIQPDGNVDDGLPYDTYLSGGWLDFQAFTHAGKCELMAEKIAAHRKLGTVIVPLAYNYDGGLTDCDDDEADGYIYILRDRVLAEYPKYKIVSAGLRKRVETYLLAEVETYNHWARGDVFGYVVSDDDGEHLDSCWGFYGLDDVTSQAKEAAEYVAAYRLAERNKRLAEHAAIDTAVSGFWQSAA